MTTPQAFPDPSMRLPPHFLSLVAENRLLTGLLVALVPLLLAQPEAIFTLHLLVDWHTIGALAGLLVLSRGLEDSGYLELAGRTLLSRVHGERTLAVALALFSAALAMVVTNDVALFIVVPLTVSLRAVADLPFGRLVVFEALAVNAGSTLSPVGNPQNLFIWQSTTLSFADFVVMMLPLGLALIVLVLAVIPLAFPSRRLEVRPGSAAPALDHKLLYLSLALYPVFLLLTDLGHAVATASAVIGVFALVRPRVSRNVDWLLLAVFVLMFVDLGLLAALPVVQSLAAYTDAIPGGVFTTSVILSQAISNVPATLLLAGITEDIQALAWGVSVGGFGLAIGSLANLIALRLSRQSELWRDFHRWSVPMLFISCLLALILMARANAAQVSATSPTQTKHASLNGLRDWRGWNAWNAGSRRTSGQSAARNGSMDCYGARPCQPAACSLTFPLQALCAAPSSSAQATSAGPCSLAGLALARGLRQYPPWL